MNGKRAKISTERYARIFTKVTLDGLPQVRGIAPFAVRGCLISDSPSMPMYMDTFGRWRALVFEFAFAHCHMWRNGSVQSARMCMHAPKDRKGQTGCREMLG